MDNGILKHYSILTISLTLFLERRRAGQLVHIEINNKPFKHQSIESKPLNKVSPKMLPYFNNNPNPSKTAENQNHPETIWQIYKHTILMSTSKSTSMWARSRSSDPFKNYPVLVSFRLTTTYWEIQRFHKKMYVYGSLNVYSHFFLFLLSIIKVWQTIQYLRCKFSK